MTTAKIPTGQVIAFRNDRLGGRLMMLVNAMRMAELTGAEFSVHWHQGTDVSEDINDPTEFFDETFVKNHFISRRDFLSLREGAVRPQERRELDVAGFRDLIAQGKNILVDEAFGIPAYKGEDAEEVAAAGAAIWRSVPLSRTVNEMITRIRTEIGPQTTAYHIRRGDILTLPRAMNRAWPNKYVYDELYQTHIEATIDQGARPILFSDDAATLARFKARYPALIPAPTLFDASEVTTGQADFLELLALSSCTQIVAPPQSAFSSGAATLGEVPICDVEVALTDEQRIASGNRLLHRLSSTDKGDGLGTGDVAQSLVHLDRFLGSQGRLGDATKIIQRHLDDGLEISFLFPRLIELYLLTDDPAGAVAAGGLMQSAQVYHRPDFAKGEMLHSYAQLSLGNIEASSRLANIAYWHDPTLPHVYEGMGALYAMGMLNETNALPLSPAAKALWQRPVIRLPSTAPAIANVLGPRPKDGANRALVPCVDPLVWDWSPFMRSFPRNALAKHRHRAVYERCLARLASQMPGPDTASLTAVFDMHVGEKDDWFERLVALGADFPDDPFVQHRLSLAATLKQNYKVAAEAGEAAVNAAPDVPAHKMWRSGSQMRQKRYRMAMNDIRSGLDAGLEFPRLHLRLATIAARADHPNVERAAIDEGIRISPRDIPLRLYRAQQSYDNGDLEAALLDLDLLMNHDVILPKIVELRQTCLDEIEEFDRYDEATQITSLGEEPDLKEA